MFCTLDGEEFFSGVEMKGPRTFSVSKHRMFGASAPSLER